MNANPKPASKRVEFADLHDDSLIRIDVLIGPDGVVPVGRATLWHYIKIGLFPKPVKVGPRISAWRVGAVRAALSTLVKEG